MTRPQRTTNSIDQSVSSQVEEAGAQETVVAHGGAAPIDIQHLSAPQNDNPRHLPPHSGPSPVAGELLDALPDACYLWRRGSDGDLVLVDANPAGCRLAQLRPELLPVLPWNEFFLPDPAVRSHLLQVLDGAPPHREERSLPAVDAIPQRWLSLVYAPFPAGHALLMVADTTESPRAEQQLQIWQDRHRRLVGALVDYIFTVQVQDGRPTRTVHSPACLAVTGCTPEAFDADPYLWINMVVPEDRDRVREQADQVIRGLTTDPVEHRIRHADGSIRWVRNTSVAHVDDRQQVRSYDGLVQDITERKLAEEALRRQEELYRTLAEFSSDFIFWHRPDGELLYVSPACSDLTGYMPDEFLQCPELFDRLVHPEDCPYWRQHRRRDMKHPTPHALELRIMTKQGQPRWVSHMCRPVHNAAGEFLGIRGSNRDITAQKQAEQQLRESAAEVQAKNLVLEVQKQQLQTQQDELLAANREMETLARQLAAANTELTLLARLDPLTRLLNRRAWEEAALQEYQRQRRHGTPYSVIMLDVDHFKAFNDTRGHQAGDSCLRQLAQSIIATCRATDFAGRYGGEEFIVLAPETPRAPAAALAERIREAVAGLQLSHPASPTSSHVTVSLGVATGRGEPWEEVVRQADEALYEAKRRGRNRIEQAPGGARSFPTASSTPNACPAVPSEQAAPDSSAPGHGSP